MSIWITYREHRVDCRILAEEHEYWAKAARADKLTMYHAEMMGHYYVAYRNWQNFLEKNHSTQE